MRNRPSSSKAARRRTHEASETHVHAHAHAHARTNAHTHTHAQQSAEQPVTAKRLRTVGSEPARALDNDGWQRELFALPLVNFGFFEFFHWFSEKWGQFFIYFIFKIAHSKLSNSVRIQVVFDEHSTLA